jgi:hypothetical protein
LNHEIPKISLFLQENSKERKEDDSLGILIEMIFPSLTCYTKHQSKRKGRKTKIKIEEGREASRTHAFFLELFLC